MLFSETGGASLRPSMNRFFDGIEMRKSMPVETISKSLVRTTGASPMMRISEGRR